MGMIRTQNRNYPASSSGGMTLRTRKYPQGVPQPAPGVTMRTGKYPQGVTYGATPQPTQAPVQQVMQQTSSPVPATTSNIYQPTARPGYSSAQLPPMVPGMPTMEQAARTGLNFQGTGPVYNGWVPAASPLGSVTQGGPVNRPPLAPMGIGNPAIANLGLSPQAPTGVADVNSNPINQLGDVPWMTA